MGRGPRNRREKQKKKGLKRRGTKFTSSFNHKGKPKGKRRETRQEDEGGRTD